MQNEDLKKLEAIRKKWCYATALQKEVELEDMVEWALTPYPYELPLSEDRMEKADEPPLAAIYSFARGCMP